MPNLSLSEPVNYARQKVSSPQKVSNFVNVRTRGRLRQNWRPANSHHHDVGHETLSAASQGYSTLFTVSMCAQDCAHMSIDWLKFHLPLHFVWTAECFREVEGGRQSFSWMHFVDCCTLDFSFISHDYIQCNSNNLNLNFRRSCTSETWHKLFVLSARMVDSRRHDK